MQPKNFGAYLLGNSLSSTGVGELCRAIPLDGPPSIRLLHVLPQELSRNANAKSLLLRNAKQWSSIKDLHALSLLDSGEAEKSVFFAYEYEQGRLLSDILARCEQEGLPLSADQAVYIVGRLSGALLSVTSAGSAYGCLSPQKILVTFEGEVKLLPGVFRDLHTTAAADLPVLSEYRRFLLPTLNAGKSARLSADRYALGALLFELLCRLPFRPDGGAFDPGARLGEVQSGAAGVEPLPEGILTILLKSCVPESPESYPDLATMKADLDQLITSGEYSPTTFNIAFLMHTLFRGEDELDAAADKELLGLDREKFRPAPPPPPPPEPEPPQRPVPPPPQPQSEDESLRFGLEPEKSNKGLLIGMGVAAAVVILAVLVYMAFFKKAGPSATETAAQEQLALLQKEREAMASKLKALEDEKNQLASQVTNAKTAEEKAKAQKAFDEAQMKLQAQKEEQKRLAESAAAKPPQVAATAAAKPPAPAPGPQPAPGGAGPAPATTAVPPPASAPATSQPPPAATPAAATPASVPPPSQPAPDKVKAGDFVELWNVDAKPKQINQLRVDMPTVARQNRVSGTIYVEVNIDETGLVTSAKVVKGLASDFGMNRACEDAAAKLKYSPAFKDGVPVKTKMTFPILVK